MEKLSGLVLDVYDDSGGAVLRELFSSPQGLPEITKEAHAITPEEYAVLPDDAFALVLVDGDVELKKFATIDEGNTALSVEYFLKTAHKLPEEAQKVAAQNLLAACECFGIEAPDLLKEARYFASDKALGVLPRYKQLLTGSRAKSLGKEYGEMAKDHPNYLSESGPRNLLRESQKETAKVKDTRGATALAATGAAGAIAKKKPDESEKKTAGLKTLAKGKGILDPSTFKAMATKAHPRAGGSSALTSAVKAPKAKPLQSAARSKLPSGAVRNPESYLKSAGVKMALSVQKMKANLDAAPDRAQKFKTHGDTPVKTPAGLSKEALGAMGALMGALTIPEHARTAKSNLAATKGSGGMVMTPRQIQQRKTQMGMY